LFSNTTTTTFSTAGTGVPAPRAAAPAGHATTRKTRRLNAALVVAQVWVVGKVFLISCAPRRTAALAPASAERQPRVTPIASTIVNASTNSTALASSVEATRPTCPHVMREPD
jgi:hypothetical protein